MLQAQHDPLLPIAAIGNSVTVAATAFDGSHVVIIASAVATTFAAIASILRNRPRRRETKKQRIARERRPPSKSAESPK